MSFLAVAGLIMTGNLKVELPQTVLGYEVPPAARQWVDRASQITDMGAQTQATFKQIADSLK